MPEEQLRHQLSKIHEALERGEEMDAETLAVVKQVADDIDKLLASRSAGEVPNQSDDVRRRIDDMILEFETKHPHITDILSQVTNLLGNMGI